MKLQDAVDILFRRKVDTWFPKYDLDVDSAASKTTPATSGADKDLFNAIRDLGWYDDVIEE